MTQQDGTGTAGTAGEVFVRMILDRLSRDGTSAAVSTEEYPEPLSGVWAVWVCKENSADEIVCEVAQDHEPVRVLDGPSVGDLTRPDALDYIASRAKGLTRREARRAMRAAVATEEFD